MADHLTQHQLVDLALGDVAEQPLLVRHLSTCPRCRAEYDEISNAVDQTLAASPRIEPPPGFDRTLLDAMGISNGATAGHAGPRTRRPWLLAATAAAVGVLAGIGGTVVLTQAEDAAPTVMGDGSALRTADGEQVGSIARSYVDGTSVIVVGVTEGRVGVRYECRLQLSGGEQLSVGEWVLESDDGAIWVVPAPASGVEAVELVTDSGRVWSSARM